MYMYSCSTGHKCREACSLVSRPGAAPAASAVAPEQPKGAQHRSAIIRRWLKVSEGVGVGSGIKARVWTVHCTNISVPSPRIYVHI